MAHLPLSPRILQFLSCFVDYKTIIRMREVSKAMRHRANAILCTVANPFRVQQQTENSCTLSFGIHNKMKYKMWKNCFRYVTNKLGIETLIFEEATSIEASLISVIITADQMHDLIGYIKPLFDNLMIYRFELEAVPLDIIKIITNIFNNKLDSDEIPLRVNVTNSRAAEFMPWLELIKKVDVNRLEYRTSSISKDDCHLLVQLAEVTKLIRIIVDVKYRRVDIIPLVREIFRRKCEQIVFEEDFGPPTHRTFISIDDVARLIQCLHNLNKKVRFYAHADASPMVAQIGMYRVVIGHANQIRFHHVER